MGNITYSKEWLVFALKHLNTAKLLFDVDHYEDIIGIELQQSLEKLLKSIMANNNTKIPKDHDLVKLYYIIDLNILEDNEIILLRVATDYYKEDRYPNPNYCLPPKEEIKEVLDFTQNLFEKVCKILDIDINEIKI